ncbi:hypothetical protein LTR84_000954 [Exophiala bonariae]|uniref:GrpB family protein n=1 Tax=Exophiala bonariae TaxID=1690606 RepID=A0AAV9NW52_9EURO|nr:hypothetical protein LTR84_000954 [Exophiala bonariae]
MLVVVEEYNPEWPIQFQEIKREIEQALLGVRYISIEHIGSTSVPGLAAKPVIDLVVISERDDVNGVIHALTAKGGYIYAGELGIPDRHVCRKADGIPARNLYVTVQDCQSVRNHLGVRDVCRRNASLRDQYGRFKMELSRREWRNVDEYCEAKNDIVCMILEQAGLSEEDRDAIRRVNTTV